MATGHRVIERGLRPDGTPRKPIRVREGYQPPDEAVAYVPPHKKDQSQSEMKVSAPLSLETRLMGGEIAQAAERPKSKSQIKNEKKRKNKREKKLEIMKKLPLTSPAETSLDSSKDILLEDTVTNDHDFATGVEIQPNNVDSKPYETVESKVTSFPEFNSIPNINGLDRQVDIGTGELEKTTGLENSDLIVIPSAKSNMEEKRNEIVDDDILDLEKQQKKLRKKLEQVSKLEEKGEVLNHEEKVKVGKRGEWEDEIKTIEKRLRCLKTK